MKVDASCMWTSCCSLLDEVMGAGAVRGEQAGFGAGPFRFAQSAGYSTQTHSYTHTRARPHTHTHPHTHSQRHTHTHALSCQSCRESFSTFRRRETLRICSTCNLLKGTAFQRPRLMKLRIKDLRRYLTLRNVNTDTCREKEDLVNLVLFHQGAESENDSYTPTTPTSPVSTPPTTDSTSPHSSTHEEPILRDDISESTNEEVRRVGRASLSDLSCVEDVERLTVRELKEILARNFISYSGCCEKWELVERVRRLFAERDTHTRLAADENVCRICMDAVIDCVLLECGHMVTCTKCGKRMSECPICRQYVIRAVHVFRS